jgi:hypothetical protein
MPSREGSNLRPLWRIRRILNKHKVTHGDPFTKKMLLSDVGSRNVYENKQDMDKMPDEKSDIYVEVTRILQKIADSDGQVVLNPSWGSTHG